MVLETLPPKQLNWAGAINPETRVSVDVGSENAGSETRKLLP